jgi:hypothetical protein
MKVGDLILDSKWVEFGVILNIDDANKKKPYRVYCCELGRADWLEKAYIEEDCEVVST